VQHLSVCTAQEVCQIQPFTWPQTILSESYLLAAEWQVRICYYWYKQMKKEFPDSAMGGFTRLLHR